MVKRASSIEWILAAAYTTAAMALTLLFLAIQCRADALPDLATFKSNIKTYGMKSCGVLTSSTATFDQKLSGSYYDAIDVFYQVADYLNDPSFLPCVAAARAVYRDQYVMGPSPAGCAGGFCPGYWNFTDGLVTDYVRTGDTKSRDAVLALAKNAAFARDNTPDDTRPATLSREVAYAIVSYLNAERLGAPRRARLSTLIDQALGHLEQYSTGTTPMKPFFASLTALALIRYNDVTPDARILPALVKLSDAMWFEWREDSQAMLYIDHAVPGEDPPNPAPDLNLLVAPVYGWVYAQTGDLKYRAQGDKLFAGGVRGGFLGNGKQFDQAYRWSLSYLRWREARAGQPAAAAPVCQPVTCACSCQPTVTP